MYSSGCLRRSVIEQQIQDFSTTCAVAALELAGEFQYRMQDVTGKD